MAKDAFDVPAGIDDVLARLQEDHDDLEELEYSEIPLDEADARWREAFEVTDMTFEPPTSEDLDHLRALVMTRFTTLPDHGKVPEPAGLGEEEREQLLAEFCQSDEAAVLLGPDGDDNEDDTVEDLAYQILTFSSDYVRGTPLRFSPVMVEIFCLDWAPRKIAVDGDGFTLLPDVLAAWIRFVGRRRGIPEHSIKDAVEAAHEYAPVMIELSQDPEEWGPAKTMALALQGRGIDITDQAALDDFVDEVNRNGGVDVLANSLTASVAPRR